MNDTELELAEAGTEEFETGWIWQSDPDISEDEIDAVNAILRSPILGHGKVVEAFESAFAAYLGRRHAVAVPSGTLGLLLTLKAMEIGPGDEVIASPYSWHQIAHAVSLAGATLVLADMDYWSCTLSPEKAAAKITPQTKAILAGNTNGHPANWNALRELAGRHGLRLLEDSTEAIGSKYAGSLVGGFGDCAIFDFSQPSALCCGEGGMVVTDDGDLARALRYFRTRKREDRYSIGVGAYPVLQAQMSNVTAALGAIQLQRLDEILARRKQTEQFYLDHIQTFEGIKPPYLAPDVTLVHWFLYSVHLGTRFSRSSRDAIIDDLKTADVEASAFCQPLHLQHYYQTLGYKKRDFFVTEKIADRVIALPFHGHLTADEVAFLVKTAKDASINVGAGSAIYL